MDINLLPAKTPVMIDTNIFIYHLGGLSTDCKFFLKRLSLNEVKGYATTVIIAEGLHRRMMLEAITKNLISPGQPFKKLKANPQLITLLSDYLADVEALLRLPLSIIEVTLADITASHQLRKNYGLFVNDSINIACTQRLGISNIVTRDNDFSSVSGITVWQPTDI